jgi:hypothetical protein
MAYTALVINSLKVFLLALHVHLCRVSPTVSRACGLLVDVRVVKGVLLTAIKWISVL